MLKIDVFNHIWPKPFFEQLQKSVPAFRDMGKRVVNIRMMTNLDIRFEVMDRFGPEYLQILSLASPPLEAMADPETAQLLARIANDSMAEIVRRHPDRFAGFVASLALNNPEGMVIESRRAVRELGAVGTLIYTNAAGRPLDGPEFQPFFRTMAELDLPIWLHPCRGADFADYQSESKSRYEIWWTLGWPYESAVTMARLVFAGLFDLLPGIKIITHHGGGIVPMLEGRIGPGWDQLGTRTSDESYAALLKQLKKRPLDYFRMFYADTALFGAAGPTRLALEFFGPQKMLFASDIPFDPVEGQYIQDTIRVIDELDIDEATRRRIYHGNAIELMRLRLA